MTASEVSSLLAIGLSTVYRAARIGMLPAVRLGVGGGAIRFRAEDVERFIRAGAERARAESEGVLPFRGGKR